MSTVKYETSSPQKAPRGWKLLAGASVLLLAVVAWGIAPAEASTGGDRVEFTVTVEPGGEQEDEEIRARTRRNVAEEVARRIEHRLEAIDIKHFAVEATGGSDVKITVYGSHDPQVIKGAVVPAGMVEVRPVLVDSNPWLGVAQQLPDGVEFHHEPGSIQTTSFFLYAASPTPLYESIELLDSPDHYMEVFPYEDGWRTLTLGDALATHEDVVDVEMSRDRSGGNFLAATLSADAAQYVRSRASNYGANQLAIIIDGEVVGLKYFSERSFSERMTLDAPDHLQSSDARASWATQVGARLAAPIPVRIAEIED